MIFQGTKTRSIKAYNQLLTAREQVNLENYTDAMDTLNQVLKEDPDFVPALKLKSNIQGRTALLASNEQP